MPTKIAHFEILSELAKSAIGAVYKANDPKTGQTIALKCIQLDAFGERAGDLEQSLAEEAENSKILSSTNITPLYGAGEIQGQFCAAMEYVQGNSIATILARREGFSIWDLLDIGRQVCSGLDLAHVSKVYHYSLEPGKIMCGWDGTVKILGFGVSSVGKFTGQVSGTPLILHYMSPEQVRGEAIDNRSNLFSLGAMFYEMVTERRAFEGADAEAVRQGILEGTPAPPLELSPKLHPLFSKLVMKALHKDPAQRYQSGRELLDDLENCKESKPSPPKKAVVASQGPAIPAKVKAAVQAKFVGAAQREADSAAAKASAAKAMGRNPGAPPRAVAAAAGQGAGAPVKSVAPSVRVSSDAAGPESAHMSAAADLRETEQPETSADIPRIATDPLMAEDDQAAGPAGTSFSEISELPPLKEVYVAPEPPSSSDPIEPKPVTMFQKSAGREEKPKVQPREMAQNAIKEVKGVPPRLMLYSVAAAVVVILFIATAIALHIYSGNSDDDGSTSHARQSQPASQPAQPTTSAAATQDSPASVPPAAERQPSAEPAAPETAAPETLAPAASPVGRHGRGKRTSSAPVAIAGQVAVDSSPQGALVQVDGASDPRWLTPLTASSLQPGQHTIRLSKAGYATDTRTVNVVAGAKSTLMIHLAQLTATLSVTSSPSGASIYVDGRNMGKLTPAQLSVDKGQHIVLVRKLGYIDETTTAQFVPGPAVTFSPTLRPLGDVDSIRTVGKMKKLFGGKGGQAGQGTVSIRTQPKGAQIAVNQHMLDKDSPVDVMLDPGNYVIDITMSDYAPIHKVISVEKGSKVLVDETMQRQ